MEGILLETISYLETKQILKVFTAERGLISLFSNKRNLPAPFCIGEWMFVEKENQDLYFLQDSTLLNPLLGLRHTSASLWAAGSMAKNILTSQLFHAASPLLYSLFKTYLEKLETSRRPTVLSASFKLKLLAHEGHLNFIEDCSVCKQQRVTLYEGEVFCLEHAPKTSHILQEEEWSLLTHLLLARKFNELESLELSNSLIKFIESL